MEPNRNETVHIINQMADHSSASLFIMLAYPIWAKPIPVSLSGIKHAFPQFWLLIFEFRSETLQKLCIMLVEAVLDKQASSAGPIAITTFDFSSHLSLFPSNIYLLAGISVVYFGIA